MQDETRPQNGREADFKRKKMNVVWSTMSWSDPTRLKDKIDNNIEIGALQPQMQEIITEITQNLC